MKIRIQLFGAALFVLALAGCAAFDLPSLLAPPTIILPVVMPTRVSLAIIRQQ